MHSLGAHPAAPPRIVEDVTVNLAMTGSRTFWLEFGVRPADCLCLPEPTKPVRTDNLWRTTCFELFAKIKDSEHYFEFNFSPSSQWAMYEFDGYRSAMRDAPGRDPEIWISRPEPHFFLAVEALQPLPRKALQLGLSAVIEETDGTKSYWALAHPPGEPDFHHPDCFTLELPPPNDT